MKETNITQTKGNATFWRKTCKDIFRITDDEEATFDTVPSEHINTYINIEQRRIKPFPTVELNRLNKNNYHTRIIKRFIKRSEKKAPGDSKISKQRLEKCTDKTLEHLTNIFNACFSAGYFPLIFKKALIKFIPKANTSIQIPLNYRPISLL